MFTRFCLAFILLLGSSSYAAAQQKPPAGRTGLDTAARNKASMAIARSRLQGDMVNKTVEKYSSGSGGNTGCSTNIGAPANDTPKTGDRYGPNKGSDQVIVVKGPVINVCK